MSEPRFYLEAEPRPLKREKEMARKRAQRARKAEADRRRALALNLDGYLVPKMPAGLSATGKWVGAARTTPTPSGTSAQSSWPRFAARI